MSRTMKSSSKMMIALAASLFLTGCVGPGMRIGPIATGADAEKTAFVNKYFGFSPAHKEWAATMGMANGFKMTRTKPKLDAEALKNVKKVAIVGFDVSFWPKSGKTESAGQGAFAVIHAAVAMAKTLIDWQTAMGMKKDEMQQVANQTFDDMKESLEQAGYKVIPADTVQTNAAYQALKFEGSEGAATGRQGNWYQAKMSAYALKTIPTLSISRAGLKFATIDGLKQGIKDKLGAVAAVGKAVGADAVLVVDANMFMQRRSIWAFNRKYLVNCGDAASFGYHNRKEPGLVADLYAADDGREIWSAALKTSVNVPTEQSMTWTFWDWFWGRTLKYEIGKLAPDFDKASKDLTAMLAYKLKQDSAK